MATFEPPKNWTEQDREHYLQQVMRSGWTRMRPYSLLFLLLGVGIAERGATPEDLKRGVRNADNPEGNLDASCWEDPEDLDDEERAQHATHVEDAERYAAAYGRPPLRTHTDVLDLLVAAGAIYEVPDGTGVARFYPKVPAPAPADVFPLDEEEAAVQRQLRIDSAYEGDSYRIIELFEPDGKRHEEVVTSLDRLARLIKGDPHDAREAVRLLTEAGDFATSLDLDGLPSHKVFRIRCNWDRFDQARIGIQGMTEDGRLSVTLPSELDRP
ncbi:DUF6042 family protein [Streptomyces sp. HUAS TT20]|uniref:DUF6042 family protein n=1 Tax=Streptomyces sp. HUAS TT20 TaxID=3447509 RepID=UPI0021DA4310|nr:DUF6042 family protein [Streptomyces sp. HUAS 15-9]UXY33238.1 DUF6042 family protein [Streptomyces sp. HUAS 15-9]